MINYHYCQELSLFYRYRLLIIHLNPEITDRCRFNRQRYHFFAARFFRQRIEEAVLRAAAHDVNAVVLTAGVVLQFIYRIPVRESKRAVRAAEVVADCLRLSGKRLVGFPCADKVWRS